MAPLIVWFLIFMAVAIPAQVLWARMLRTLREHGIQYDHWGYDLDALVKYRRLVRQGSAGVDQRRLLWWLYATMALAWAAFIGLLTFGLPSS
jgi:hypothetical protein